MSDDSHLQTPMMQQYLTVKKEYPDHLLLYRMGDFYELFLDDAITASKVLDITLTSRNKGSENTIPMCGVPFHALDSYLSKLVKEGYKAAICEQVSKPGQGTLVERKVVRIVTPGTVIDETLLERSSNNYIATLEVGPNEQYSIAYGDISTLDFFILEQVGKANLLNDLRKINPKEIVLSIEQYTSKVLGELSDLENINITKFYTEAIKLPAIVEQLKESLSIKELDIFRIDPKNELVINSLSRLVEYIKYTQKTSKISYGSIKNIQKSNYMRLDIETITNLEIFRSNRGNSSSKDTNLINVLDKTSTSMGARNLKSWVVNPLLDIEAIHNRLENVETFFKNSALRDDCLMGLKQIQDIERIFARIASGLGNARDLRSMENSLTQSTQLIDLVRGTNPNINKLIGDGTHDLTSLINEIQTKIVDNPPFSTREGGMINSGVEPTLDQINQSIHDSKTWIENLEKQEREATKISNLKVGFNSVFGYYIEVTKSYLGQVPSHYHRKQTLVNAERYITDELKQKEQIVLSAKEQIDEIEFAVFIKICDEVRNNGQQIHQIAKMIADIDCIVSLAVVAQENKYVKSTITKNFDIEIKEGRHPVVENTLNSGDFVPNDTELNNKKYIHLITGPNMAGKSTYIRQIALMQIMAQIGSFVPADSAKLGLVDAIYTRIGAGDALAQGLSTFMVEMIETAKILNNATENSLVILDEVGRGTSTIDGLSIAQAIVEHIAEKIKCKTLFATHFHELVELEQRIKTLKNYHFEITEKDNQIRFVHKIKEGGTNNSYGIEVAKIAGIPSSVVDRAKSLLNKNSTNQMKFNI